MRELAPDVSRGSSSIRGVRARRYPCQDQGASPRHLPHHAVPLVHRRPPSGRRRRGAATRRWARSSRRHGDGVGAARSHGGLALRCLGKPRVAAAPATRLSCLLVPTLRTTGRRGGRATSPRALRDDPPGRARHLRLPAAGLRVVRRVEASRDADGPDRRAGDLMPAVIPAELWQESGRWTSTARRCCAKDRHERDFCRADARGGGDRPGASRGALYRDLPDPLPIQVKFRDEQRPRFGLMRGREFI